MRTRRGVRLSVRLGELAIDGAVKAAPPVFMSRVSLLVAADMHPGRRSKQNRRPKPPKEKPCAPTHHGLSVVETLA